MNVRTTIVLLLCVVAIGAFLYFDKSPDVDPIEVLQARRQTDGKPLFTAEQLASEHVASVKIERDGKTLVMEKQGMDWTQTQPVRIPLNSWSVGQVADQAAALKYVEKVTPGTPGAPGGSGAPSLKDVSLDPPQAVVTIVQKDDKGSYTLKLGRKTVGGRGYVQLEGDKHLYIVNDDLHSQVLDQKFDSWRRRTFKSPAEGEADKVTLTRGSETITMVKSEGAWSFAPPHSGRVDADAVRSLLTSLSGMYIDQFVADEPTDISLYGLDAPATRLTVYTNAPATGEGDSADKKPPSVKSLLIGASVDLKKEKFFATFGDGEAAGPIVVSISKSDAEKFDKTVNDLRDPKVTRVKSADVTELAINRADGVKVSLKRGVNGWTFGDPKPEYEVDQGEAASLVDAITGADAREYEANAAPTGEPEATISLTATGRAEPDVLKVFAAAAETGRRMVIRNNETTGYLVAGDKLARAFTPVLALRERRITRLDREKVDHVELTRADGLKLTFARDLSEDAASKDWTLAGQQKFENLALSNLLGAVLNLKAESWITGDEKPGQAAHRVTIRTAAGDSLKLAIDPSTQVAAAEGIDAAFKVTADVVEKFNAEFRHRTVLDIKRDDITNVSVTKDGRTIVLSKSGADFVGAKDEKVNQSAAAGIFDTLAGLRVEKYLESTPGSPPESSLLATIVITAGDASHELKLYEAFATLGDKRFTLEKAQIDKLTAKLVDGE